VRSELEVLNEQLDELLEEGAVDGDDALEIAMVAGLVARLEASSGSLAAAELWRKGPGQPLLEEAWSQFDLDGLVENLELLIRGEGTDEQVEEVFLDLDEVISGAVWLGWSDRVLSAAREMGALVRMNPESFAHLSGDAVALTQRRSLAEAFDAYAYWFAMVDVN